MPPEREQPVLPETPDRHALLRAAAAQLPGDTPRLDAELLLAHALGEPRLTMLASTAPLTAAVRESFHSLVDRRRTHEPVAHILGEREFWSLPFKVTPDVLIPRPDSETLIAEALSARTTSPPATILDLGTGSSALLLAALSEWPSARGLGTDSSPAAIAVARENASRLGLADRTEFRLANWADGLDTKFDIILCNPPYIPDGEQLMPDVAYHEPHAALFGGADGLDPYRLLFPQLAGLLAPGGTALFEFGVGQADALRRLADACGLHATFAADLAGRPRVIRLSVP